ncbi:MAG TPA: MlaD family protein [Candidatus Deferrimicrobium sp.]|nr:MlaD family protein [Candidatus Deferrimicrobium sp.]
MKRTIGVKWGNLRTGILLMIAIVVMLWASLSGGGTSVFERKGRIVCFFRNVNGLVSGSPVWMSGVEVGNVRSVEFVNLDTLRQVKVICRIKKEVWPMLTDNTEVMVGTIGLVGDKYVEIIPGTRGRPVLNDMGVLITRDAGDASAMFKEGEQTLSEVRSVVDNLDLALAKMNRGEGTLGRLATDDRLYRELTALTERLSRLVTDLQENQERLTVSVEKSAAAIERLSNEFGNDTGTVGRMLHDRHLYDNLVQTSAGLDTVLRKLNTGQGSLGLMVNDTALYVAMTNLVARVNTLVADIEKNPRKYFKFSVF